MATNNLVTLIGNLGDEPATLRKDENEYVKLSLATTDSYKVEETGEWKQKNAVWHTILAFSPTVRGYAKNYKKGERVKITGSLSYRSQTTMIDGEERRFRSATIIANRIEDARLPKKGA